MLIISNNIINITKSEMNLIMSTGNGSPAMYSVIIFYNFVTYIRTILHGLDVTCESILFSICG